MTTPHEEVPKTDANSTSGSEAALTPQYWLRLRALVEEALLLPPESREAFLDESCGGDHALHARVARLVASCERPEKSWDFLARPASELAAPMLAADGSLLADLAMHAEAPLAAFRAALADRYVVGEELGRGGMATVYVAEDLRHARRVALKTLDPQLGAMLGAKRFLAEIRVTANLKHPNLLPLFDSGEAAGLLYYVMPLVDGSTLRERLKTEGRLPVGEAVRIVRAIAGALDYSHRHGVVHRDIKPANILLQDGEPLLADFGIAVADVGNAESGVAATGTSLGTPRYMSPEQAAGDAVDGRSDIYSLACVLHELLAGAPPFTGSSMQSVIAKVLTEAPPSVRELRPEVPAYIEAAISRALSKRPADRYDTARAFGDALVAAPGQHSVAAEAPNVSSHRTRRLALGAVAVAAVSFIAFVEWNASRKPPAPSWYIHDKLIDQTHLGSVTITPDGGALVYTGPVEARRALMIRREGQIEAHAIAGTEGGAVPSVAPNGRRLLFRARDDSLRTVSIDSLVGTSSSTSWQFGNGAWVDDSVVVTENPLAGLYRSVPGGALVVLTRLDTTRRERRHAAPFLIPGTRWVVFTVRSVGGPGVVTGPLAIASLDSPANAPSSHSLLGVTARQAIAFVDGWLLYTSEDGNAIMATRLDVASGRVIGSPVSVLEDAAGDLESASLANNGTLLYVRRPRANAIVFIDSTGAVRPAFAKAGESYMYPRYSPDGKQIAMAINVGGKTDAWVYDIASAAATRMTTSGVVVQPTWMPDGRHLVYIERALLMSQRVGGDAAASIPGTESPFAPTVAPDGSVIFQRRAPHGSGLWSTSLDGKASVQPVVQEPFVISMPAVSHDGRWLAYVSLQTGRAEVWARAFPGPGQPVQISDGGGTEPAWSPSRHQIYYLKGGTLMAVTVAVPQLAVTSRQELFKVSFDDHLMPHRNYDPAPTGGGFVMIAPPARPAAVTVLHWLPALRERLASAK